MKRIPTSDSLTKFFPIALRIFCRFSGNAKPAIASSSVLQRFGSLARPFSSRHAGNDVIEIDLGTTNSCVAVMEGKTSIDSSSVNTSEAAPRSLPFWLQNIKANEDSDAKATPTSQGNNEENVPKLKSQDLQKKWNDTCLRLHPTSNNGLSSGSSIAPIPLTVNGLYDFKASGRQNQPSVYLEDIFRHFNVNDIFKVKWKLNLLHFESSSVEDIFRHSNVNDQLS
ncbi:hypothetical protein QQ045_013585 [Rhodiola kirilowii]